MSACTRALLHPDTERLAAYLRPHVLQYEGGEPCSVCGHRLAPPTATSQRASAFPSAVLPHFLYLGSYDHASRSDALKMLEITHILNVRPCNLDPSALLLG